MPLLAFPGGYGGLVMSDGGLLSLSCCIRRDVLAQVRERYPHPVLVAADPPSGKPNPYGIEALRVVLRTAAQALRPVARIHVPLAHGRLLAELHRDGEVLSQHQEDGVVIVHARVEARTLGRLRRDGITVELPG